MNFSEERKCILGNTHSTLRAFERSDLKEERDRGHRRGSLEDVTSKAGRQAKRSAVCFRGQDTGTKPSTRQADALQRLCTSAPESLRVSVPSLKFRDPEKLAVDQAAVD